MRRAAAIGRRRRYASLTSSSTAFAHVRSRAATGCLWSRRGDDCPRRKTRSRTEGLGLLQENCTRPTGLPDSCFDHPIEDVIQSCALHGQIDRQGFAECAWVRIVLFLARLLDGGNPHDWLAVIGEDGGLIFSGGSCEVR